MLIKGAFHPPIANRAERNHTRRMHVHQHSFGTINALCSKHHYGKNLRGIMGSMGSYSPGMASWRGTGVSEIDVDNTYQTADQLGVLLIQYAMLGRCSSWNCLKT